ncbi:MAG: hypothetical protein COA44_00380 [Arcobacter sp.]|nr:MAG: hypothetical protein COA44_00380 [Arcobacter sp.]
MKHILLLSILLALSLEADYVKKTIGVCSSQETLLELNEYSKTHLLEKGGLELELWLMSHDCKIIDKNTQVEVLDYTGKKTEILKVLLKKTGDIVYTLNKGIQIEQPGQDNIIYKF